MKDPHLTLEIDRLVLTGLDLAPGAALRLRTLVARELRQELSQQAGLEGLTSVEWSRLRAPALNLPAPGSEAQLARGLAQGIVQSLRVAD
jgi:hypothetical protein